MPAKRSDPLKTYRDKRTFDHTPEPRGRRRGGKGRLYTIQKHDARRTHFDLRLELDGVLKSWAVTKGPSLDPSDKRLAVQTEDHPVDYATFEGRIPEGNYGAGTVMLWDRGTWEPIGEPRDGLEKGKLAFRLNGDRLKGRWALVRFRKNDAKRKNWLLIKERDDEVDRKADVVEANVTSVASGRAMQDIAAAPEDVWTGTGGKKRRATSDANTGPRGKGTVPAFVAPALATLVDDVPEGDDWLFEIKFDGYRAQAAVSGPDARIYTRAGLDWTDRFHGIAEALVPMKLDRVLLDGEIVVVDERGRSDFAALQAALKYGKDPLSYFVFDLLAVGGKSLRTKPLVERKARLKALLGDAGRKGPVYYTDHIERNGATVLSSLCESGFEGVIAKRRSAPYRSGRGRSWLKIKCGREQEFVIAGWSPSTRKRVFSSLILAVNEGKSLRYVGRVGSGFSADDLDELAGRFRAVKKSPVTGPVPNNVARSAHWVRPALVAQIEFAGFTGDGLIRQGRFVGLREDKKAEEVVREKPQPVEKAKEGAAGTVRLTHPDKILFPEQGVTKRDLADYYEAVAERMLPHVERRLVSLVRCPEGRARSCFFQRHAGQGLPKAFRSFAVKGKDGKKEDYIYIDGRDGLVSAAQMGVLELHIWGSHIDRIDEPDRIVFDLDPDPSLGFEAPKAAAAEIRGVLESLDLQSFPLLTGGKGVHVVVPIRRGHPWPRIKDFARAVAERLAEADPDRYVATMSKAKRKGKTFIDFFRNDRSATAIAPYSTRTHAGAPLAWPVSWSELDGIEAASAVTIENADERLRRKDPWADYHRVNQSLKVGALRALDL